jgi:YVTN family beta-propeller protein
MRPRPELPVGLAVWRSLALAATAVVVHALGLATPTQAYCAYVANSGSNFISVIDTATNTVSVTIEEQCSFGRCDPDGLALTPNGHFLFVTNGGTDDHQGNTVSVIDTATNTVVATIAVGVGPALPAITPDGRFAYIPNQGFSEHGQPGLTVSVIDTAKALSDASSAVIQTMQFDSTPLTVAFSPDSRFAYISTFTATTGAVTVLDTATNTVQSTVSGDGGFLAITPHGDFLYGAMDVVVVTDTAKALSDPTHAVIDTITVGTFPFDAAVSPDGHFVYVVNCGQGCFDGAVSGSGISIINTTSNTIASTVPLSPQNDPVSLAITPDGRFAYVANSFADTVTVIDTAKALTNPAEAIITTISVEARPFDVAIASLPMCVGGHPTCVGDCRVDRQVTVDELLTMVNIALGNAEVLGCQAGDRDGGGQITIDEILTAVHNALNGC